MTALMVMGGAQLAQGIMQGIAGSAAQDQQNQQAIRQYIASEHAKGQANGREMFQSAYNWQQQVKRNQYTRESAYLNKEEQARFIQQESGNIFNTLYAANRQQTSALSVALADRGISKNSGMAASIAAMGALTAMKSATKIKQNIETAKNNLEKQTKAAMDGQGSNVFIGAYQATNQPPILGSTTMPLIAGVIGGMASGASTVAGAYYQKS